MEGLARQPGSPVNPGAIHRCVLAGFPSQIGRKGEEREYEGPRGLRFVLSPGSSLHRQAPPWVVAAELVETTRLYARFVGRVRADWVERVAAHLVTREVFEPHWMAASGQVAAWEKLSLHGLVLVPRRRVPFGPIDPKAARDIFIQAALVDEEIRTDGEFLTHNRELIEQLEKLEAKKRVQDVLVDLRARFDFYDARVPAEIHSTPSFEKWRREAERRNPKLLLMSREDLLRPGASGLSTEDFPDLLELDGLRLPLDYRHEPGHPEDGVTVTVPLGALGQIPAPRLEWLVPGMLKEKIVALLRTLPKRQRVRFVPAAEYAEGAVESLDFGQGSLPGRLAEHLHRLTATPVVAADFGLEEVPAHLRMNIHVLDAAGRVMATGRDVELLRRQLGRQVRDSLEATPLGHVESASQPSLDPKSADSPRSTSAPLAGQGVSGETLDPSPPVLPAEIVKFPESQLPKAVAVRQGGTLLRAFTALVDLGAAVALRLLPTEAEALELHRQGVLRLLALALESEIRPMLEYLPQPGGVMGLDQLALLHAPYGARPALESGLLLRIAERAASLGGGDPSAVRDPEAFKRLVAECRPRLWDAGAQSAELLGRVLSLRLALDRTLDAPLPSTWQDAVEDVRGQVDALTPPGFFGSTPWERLVHLPRYLQAASIRLQKLRDGGHRRDAAQMAQLRPFLERLDAHRTAMTEDAAATGGLAKLDRFRWLLEEFRVSLFAQELRTAVPISATRLEREWARVFE